MLVYHTYFIELQQWYRSRRIPIQRPVRPHRIVVNSPLFYENLRLLKCIKYFSIQKFVSKSCIKTFVISILPRTSRFDTSSFFSNCWDPVSYWLLYKLRSILRSDAFMVSPDDGKIGQYIENICELSFWSIRIASHSQVYSSRMSSVLNAFPS